MFTYTFGDRKTNSSHTSCTSSRSRYYRHKYLQRAPKDDLKLSKIVKRAHRIRFRPRASPVSVYLHCLLQRIPSANLIVYMSASSCAAKPAKAARVCEGLNKLYGSPGRPISANSTFCTSRLSIGSNLHCIDSCPCKPSGSAQDQDIFRSREHPCAAPSKRSSFSSSNSSSPQIFSSQSLIPFTRYRYVGVRALAGNILVCISSKNRECPNVSRRSCVEEERTNIW